MIKILSLLALLSMPLLSQSQVLIALVFGDKLHSEKLDFGLTAGLNSSALKGLEFSQTAARLKLGLFFDIKISERLILSPELVLKSGYGHQNIPLYSVGDSSIDANLTNTEINRKINYISLPITLKIKTINYLYFNVGGQFSLTTKSFDYFFEKINGDEILYSRQITDNLSRFDVGGLIGFSYKLMKGKGVGINANYYHGFVNLNANKLPGGSLYNRSIQLSANIPIGGKSNDEKFEIHD